MQPDTLPELPENVQIVIVDSSGNLREDMDVEELSESLSDKDALIWCDISSTEGGKDSAYWHLLTRTFGFDELTVENSFQ
jgi:putative N-acetylmannosamine-6-phosphate epimerase